MANAQRGESNRAVVHQVKRLREEHSALEVALTALQRRRLLLAGEVSEVRRLKRAKLQVRDRIELLLAGLTPPTTSAGQA